MIFLVRIRGGLTLKLGGQLNPIKSTRKLQLYYQFYMLLTCNVVELITFLVPNVCQMLWIWSLKFIYYINGPLGMQFVMDMVPRPNGRPLIQ